MAGNHPPIPQTFEAFWPYYMAAHQDPRNRAIHYVGSGGGLVATAIALPATGLPANRELLALVRRMK